MILAIVISNVVIANAISVLEAINSFWKHSTINRKKQLYLLVSQCILNSLSYLVLGVYAAVWNNAYAILKYLFIIFRHKEEKVILGNFENFILNVPYLIFPIFCFSTDGWLGILYGVIGFIDDSRFWLKSDKVKQLASSGVQLFYAIYNFIVMDMVKGTKHVINLGINLWNYYRLLKYGEAKFYTKIDITAEGENYEEKKEKQS